uniref:Uncharacterized protein n=1 Tax=Opuntia streptacantha TaxID=393608 RepID=A0A7C8ZJ28_OPUST
MIKEASCTFQINPQVVIPASDASAKVLVPSEAMNKPEVQGDDVDATDDVGSQHWASGGKLVGHRSEGQLERPRVLIWSARTASTQQALIPIPRPRQNGSSEEVIKTYQRGPAVQDVEVNGHIELPNATGSITHRLEGSGESSAPPGF